MSFPWMSFESIIRKSISATSLTDNGNFKWKWHLHHFQSRAIWNSCAKISWKRELFVCNCKIWLKIYWQEFHLNKDIALNVKALNSSSVGNLMFKNFWKTHPNTRPLRVIRSCNPFAKWPSRQLQRGGQKQLSFFLIHAPKTCCCRLSLEAIFSKLFHDKKLFYGKPQHFLLLFGYYAYSSVPCNNMNCNKYVRGRLQTGQKQKKGEGAFVRRCSSLSW